MKKFTAAVTLVVTTVIGYIFYRFLRSRATRPSRVLLYTPKKLFGEWPRNYVAKIATVTLNSFHILDPLNNKPAGDWDFVAGAAYKNKKWIYFRNSIRDGLGYVDANNNIISNTYLRVPKEAVAGNLFAIDGRGYILITDFGGVNFEFAQILDDDTFVEWSYAIMPDLGDVDVVRGLTYGHMLHGTITNGIGSKTTILDIKTGKILYSKTWEDPWEGVITEGNIVFFYDTHNEKSQTGYIDQNYQIVITKGPAYDPGLLPAFNRVTTIAGAHICWNWSNNGNETIRVLTKNGLRISKHISFGDYRLDDSYFLYIVPC